MTERWHRGAQVEATFDLSFRPEPTPAWLSAMSVMHGHRPLELGESGVWVDLGCGLGLGALGVAAAHPHLEVWACDVNADHIDDARDLARRAGIDNATFEVAAIEDLVTRGLGPDRADVIVLEGVLSWVGDNVRDSVVEFVDQRLARGGMVYASVNTHTGWAEMVPIRDLLLRIAEIDRRPIAEVVGSALDFVDALHDGGARMFPIGATEMATWRSMRSRGAAYVAHELMTESWRPLSWADVAGPFSEIGCRYVGSADPLSPHLELTVPSGHLELVEHEHDVDLRQAIVELANAKTYELHMFRRGEVASTAAERAAWLDAIRLAPTGADFHDGWPVATGAGDVQLPADLYGPLLDAIAHGPATLAELRQVEPWSTMPERDLATGVALLIAGGLATPATQGGDPDAARAATARLNRSIVERVELGHDQRLLFAAETATAFGSGPLWVRTVAALADGAVPAERRALIDDGVEWLRRLDRPLYGPSGALSGDEVVRAVSQQVDDVLRRWPAWFERAGIVLITGSG